MTPEEFADFECERLDSYARAIEQSLHYNPELTEVERQVVIEFVMRAIGSEKEFAREDPDTYKDLYYVR